MKWILPVVAALVGLQLAQLSEAQIPLSAMTGVYRSPCEFIVAGPFNLYRIYFNSEMIISDGGHTITVIWRMYPSSACSSVDIQLIMSSNTALEVAVTSNQTYVNMPLSTYTVKPVSSFGATALNTQCPRSSYDPVRTSWENGETYDVTHTCVLDPKLPIPGNTVCPTFYTSFQYIPATQGQNATIYSSPLWDVLNAVPSCSANNRCTWAMRDRPFVRRGGEIGAGLPQPTCQAMPSTSLCAEFVDYMIDVPNGVTLDAMEQDLYTVATPMAWSAMFSDRCRSAVGTLTCSMVYKRCEDDRTSTTPCYASCQNIATNCNATETARLNTLLQLLMVNSYTNLCAANGAPQCMPSGTFNAGLVLSTRAQLPWPTCGVYQGVSCAGVVDYPVYIPGNSSMALLEQEAINRFYFIFGLAPQGGGCLDAVARYACSQVFLECDTSVIATVPVPFPRLPCRSLCDDYATNCSTFVTFDARLAPNCSSVGRYLPGVPDFPVSQTDFPLGLSSTCSRGSNSASIQASFRCYWPLTVPQDPNAPTINDGGCALPCKMPFFSDAEYEEQDTVLRAISFIHVLGLAFTTVTLLFVMETKSRATTYLIHLHLCLWPATIAILLSLMISKPEMTNRGYGVFALGCKDNTQVYSQGENSFCDFETVCNQFTIVAGCAWLLAYSFELMMSITRLKERFTTEQLTYSKYFFYVFCYTIPMAVVFAAIDQRALAGDSLFPWCSIEASPMGREMWKIVASLNIIASFFLVIALVSLLRTWYGTRNLHGVNSFIYVRPTAFMVIFLGIFGYSYGYHFYLWSVQDKWAGYIQDWILCWVVYLPGGYANACEQRPDVGTIHDWHASINIILSLGWISFLIIGLTQSNINLWKVAIVRRYPKAAEWEVCGYRCCRPHTSRHDDATSHRTSKMGAGSSRKNSQQHTTAMGGVSSPDSVVMVHNGGGANGNANTTKEDSGDTSAPTSPSANKGRMGLLTSAVDSASMTSPPSPVGRAHTSPHHFKPAHIAYETSATAASTGSSGSSAGGAPGGPQHEEESTVQPSAKRSIGSQSLGPRGMTVTNSQAEGLPTSHSAGSGSLKLIPPRSPSNAAPPALPARSASSSNFSSAPRPLSPSDSNKRPSLPSPSSPRSPKPPGVGLALSSDAQRFAARSNSGSSLAGSESQNKHRGSASASVSQQGPASVSSKGGAAVVQLLT